MFFYFIFKLLVGLIDDCSVLSLINIAAVPSNEFLNFNIVFLGGILTLRYQSETRSVLKAEIYILFEYKTF